MRINSISAARAYSRPLNREQNNNHKLNNNSQIKYNAPPQQSKDITFGALPKQFSRALFLILDGFGQRVSVDDFYAMKKFSQNTESLGARLYEELKNGEKNPFANARMPFYKTLLMNIYEDTLYRPIEASGTYVGLPPKVVGNSEVGHNNLGAGKLVPQELMRINDAIEDRSFVTIQPFIDAIEHAKKNNSTLHLMTLLSDGYVHSHTSHLFELIKMAATRGVEKLKVHAFLDGRDVKEGTAPEYVKRTNGVLKECGYDPIASFIGMKYPMERDGKWEPIEVAYNLLVHGKAEHEVKTFEEAYNSLHTFSIEKGKFLEKDMPPVKLADFEPIKNGDSVIFTNYRNDRTRQLTDALTQPKCEAHFLKGQERLKDLNFVCMTEYNPDFNLPVAFPVKVEDNTLPDILDKLGCETFFTTERDKQAHLTFFLRGKKEGLLSQSGYNLIPSSKGKLTERMKGGKIKDAIISWITRDDDSRACIANFPNPDIIGHEAIYDKAANTLQILDKRAIKPIVEAARDNDVATIITADHGNIEDLTHGGHTNNPVPFIAILPGLEEEISKGIVYLDDAKDAAISRVAPSFLDILGIKPPAEMYDSLFKMKEV